MVVGQVGEVMANAAVSVVGVRNTGIERALIIHHPVLDLIPSRQNAININARVVRFFV